MSVCLSVFLSLYEHIKAIYIFDILNVKFNNNNSFEWYCVSVCSVCVCVLSLYKWMNFSLHFSSFVCLFASLLFPILIICKWILCSKWDTILRSSLWIVSFVLSWNKWERETLFLSLIFCRFLYFKYIHKYDVSS